MRKLAVFLIALECMVLPPVGAAESLEAFLENASRELLAEIHEGRDTFDQDPEALYKKMDGKLADLVDFPSITRGVMGKYYQDATTEQRAAFQSTFRTSIVQLRPRPATRHTSGPTAQRSTPPSVRSEGR